MMVLSIRERIDARLETAVGKFECIEIKAELGHLKEVAQVGLALTRWAKGVTDAEASRRRADLLGDKAEAQLYALMLKTNPPANDADLTTAVEGAEMDDHREPTPEELVEFSRSLDAKLDGVVFAPETKNFRNRRERRRAEAAEKHLARSGPRGAART